MNPSTATYDELGTGARTPQTARVVQPAWRPKFQARPAGDPCGLAPCWGPFAIPGNAIAQGTAASFVTHSLRTTSNGSRAALVCAAGGS